jgi:DNA-binding MarR family transcriptional regulator
MESERFAKFTLLVDGIYKNVHKIKLDTAPGMGIKSVHVFWLYSLLGHPEGLTATELASITEIDRSLVSREIAKLCESGYIEYIGGGGKQRNYNCRLVLTKSGVELAERIRLEAIDVQEKVGEGINKEDLEMFYRVLQTLHSNFVKITKAREQNTNNN